jgi:arylsulfatase A-like enzyme
LRGSKLSLYEGGIRMPFIISWPGHIPAGKTDESSDIVSTDLIPTLTGMAGISLPANYHGDGTDRSSLFKGKASARGKDMFWEYGRNTIAFDFPKLRDRSPNLAVRSGEWKLLMNSDGTDAQLYNVVTDKNETTDQAASEPKRVAELKDKLLAWWQGMPRLKVDEGK